LPGVRPRVGRQILPRSYDTDTELVQEVPPGGIDRADFALTLNPPKGTRK